MKKLLLAALFVGCFSARAHAQLMVAKMVGKGSKNFGLGYGLFTYIEIPLRNENQSFRIELLDLAAFPTKGENLFTSKEDVKGYISIKLGYKYVFSETQQGFYLEPSAGYCRAVFALANEPTASYGDGIAGALEGGYNLPVGENGHALAFGLKYEYDHGSRTYIIQSVGFRVSYSFGLFRKKSSFY